MIYNQATLFLVFILNGFLIGIIFDFFRVIRKTFRVRNITVYIHDILFWVLAGLATLYMAFIFNNGIIRGYMVVAIVLGTILYMVTFSSYIMDFCVSCINLIKKVFEPIKIILKKINYILFELIKFKIIKPIYFLIININKKYLNKIKINNITYSTKLRRKNKKTPQNQKI